MHARSRCSLRADIGRGQIVGGNAELERLFGYGHSELLGQPVEILIPGRFQKVHPAHRKGYTDQPRLRPMGAGLELFARRKDASEFPVDIMLGPVETDQGRLTLSVIRDTSERKSAEQALRQREQQLDLLVENVRKHEELQAARQQLADERDRLKLLLEINNAVVSKLEIRKVFAAISSSLRPLTEHDYSQIVLHDPETGELRIRALDFPKGKGFLREGLVVPVENTPVGMVYKTRQPLLVERLEKERFPSEMTDRLLGEGVRSMCLVPLIVHDRTLGVLSIGSPREAAFSPADLELETMVAKQIAIAIDNALAYEQIARMKERLELEKLYLEEEVRSEAGFEEIIGKSAALKHVLKQVETVAPTDSTVLITGKRGPARNSLPAPFTIAVLVVKGHLSS